MYYVIVYSSMYYTYVGLVANNFAVSSLNYEKRLSICVCEEDDEERGQTEKMA